MGHGRRTYVIMDTLPIRWTLASTCKARPIVRSRALVSRPNRCARDGRQKRSAAGPERVLGWGHREGRRADPCLALGIVAPEIVGPSGTLRGWTAGAIGVMTLAVMTRASLGHTSQPLAATRPRLMIYVAAVLAAVAQITAAFDVLRSRCCMLRRPAWVSAFSDPSSSTRHP